jgi:hypothetical protein
VKNPWARKSSGTQWDGNFVTAIPGKQNLNRKCSMGLNAKAFADHPGGEMLL